jgi:hypothetical protein
MVSVRMGARYTLQNDGSVVTLMFSDLGNLMSMYGRGFVRERRWVLSVKEKDLCLDVVDSGRDSVVVKHGWCCCCAKHPERTHVKLRGEASLRGGKYSGQGRRCKW